MQNILTMVLQMRNHTATTLNNMNTQLRQVTTSAAKMGTTFGKSVKASHSSLSGLLGALISVKALIIGAFVYKVVQATGRAFGAATKAAEEQSIAILKLANNLASYNNYTRENVMLLTKQSDALQMLLGIADDQIVTLQSILAGYGMEAAEIKKLTPLILDFAAAKKLDLTTAFNLAGKASVGFTATLSRYGVVLDDSLSKSEKYAGFLKYIANFEGTAASQAKTYTGQIARMKTAWSDMLEPFGTVIAKSVEGYGIIATLTAQIVRTGAFMDKWKYVLIDIGTKALTSVNNALKYMFDTMRNPAVQRTLIIMGQAIKVVLSGVSTLITLLTRGLGLIARMGGVYLAEANKLKAAIFGSKDDKNAAAAEAKAKWKELWQYIDDGSKDVSESISNTFNATKDGAKTINDVLSTNGLDKYKAKMEEHRRTLEAAHAAEQNALLSGISNRGKYNAEMEKTFKLSKSMAEQFSTASRLEQEQTKWMLGKISRMSSNDVGNLSEQEKKLISKQSVLQQALEQSFGEYVSKSLGMKSEVDDSGEVDVSIDLTDDAKQLLQVNRIDRKTQVNRQYERAAQ